jgi:hypothetical protein
LITQALTAKMLRTQRGNEKLGHLRAFAVQSLGCSQGSHYGVGPLKSPVGMGPGQIELVGVQSTMAVSCPAELNNLKKL